MATYKKIMIHDTFSRGMCYLWFTREKTCISFGDTWQDILLKLLACGTFVSSSGYVSYNLRSLGKIDMYLLRYLMCKKILANDMLIIWHFSFESVCIDVKPCASLFASYRKVYILWYPYGLGDMQCMTRLMPQVLVCHVAIDFAFYIRYNYFELIFGSC